MTPVIGLTGGIGCGKSTVARLFASCGAGIVDTDVIAHSLTEPNGSAMTAIHTTFGPEFICADGSLDRARMRRHVFSDATARQQLEMLLHPMIREEALKQLARLAPNHPYLVLVVPLMARSPEFRQLSDRILVVDCAQAVQLARVTQRNGLSENEARAIISAQASREEVLALADDIICNDSTPEALATQVRAMDRQYRRTSH